MEAITIYTRGIAEGEPGPAAVGVRVIADDGSVLLEETQAIGNANELFAEFAAAAFGLSVTAEQLGEDTRKLACTHVLQNKSVHAQLDGQTPIVNPGIVPHFLEVHNARVLHFPDLSLRHEETKEKDVVTILVEKALDAS